jgi:simple sugar transport system permease protein
MIAGEFDLSVGSMIGFSGIIIALLTIAFRVPLWLSILIAFALALAIGAINGFLILRTGLPSFIVTLASLFILRGLTIYIPIRTNGSTIIGGLKTAARHDWLAPLFGGRRSRASSPGSPSTASFRPSRQGRRQACLWSTAFRR